MGKAGNYREVQFIDSGRIYIYGQSMKLRLRNRLGHEGFISFLRWNAKDTKRRELMMFA